MLIFFFFSSRRRHTRFDCDWSSDVCSSDLLDAWRTIQRSHAIANGCYVAAVNRVGQERPSDGGDGEGIEFWGSSFLADPFGAGGAEGPPGRGAVVVAEGGLDRLEEVRRGGAVLRGRRGGWVPRG